MADGGTTLGDAIRERRGALGLSQRALAAAAGVSGAFVSQVENGQRQPSLDVLRRLATALETSTGALLARPPGEDSPLGLVHAATSLAEIEALVHDDEDALRLATAAKDLVAGPRAAELEAYAPVVVEFAELLEAFARHRYRAMTGAAIVVVASALSYVVDPEDAWPDAHPHGHLDDVGVLAFTHALVAEELADFHAWQRSR